MGEREEFHWGLQQQYEEKNEKKGGKMEEFVIFIIGVKKKQREGEDGKGKGRVETKKKEGEKREEETKNNKKKDELESVCGGWCTLWDRVDDGGGGDVGISEVA